MRKRSCVAQSCKPGTEGTDKCNYGRSCGALKVDGKDVGQTLIAEGLAVPFVCGRNGCPPTPSPWCGYFPEKFLIPRRSHQAS